jgi:uncharacterized protein
VLKRKIQSFIEEHFRSKSNKVLIIDGARQIGKSYIIRYVCRKWFSNYIEINLLEDVLGAKLFEHTSSVEDFYIRMVGTPTLPVVRCWA